MLTTKGNIPSKVTYLYDKENKALIADNDSPVTQRKVEESTDLEILVCDNVPMDNIQIKEYLGNDNYAVSISASGTDKVMDMSVEFHCDKFMNEVIKDGIDKGGKLKGEFLWGTIDNRVKLILKDSNTYKNIKSYLKRKKSKPLSNKSLVIGGVYEDKQEVRYIYFGRIDTLRYDYRRWAQGMHKAHPQYKFTRTPMKDVILFAKVSSKLSMSALQSHIDRFNIDEEFILGIYVQESQTFINHVGNVTLVDDFIDKFQEFKSKYVIFNSDYVNAEKPEQLSRFCNISDLVHMQKSGLGHLQPFLKVYHAIDGKVR